MAGAAPPKRYITTQGFERLREQFHQLLHHERPRVTHEVTVAAAHGDRSENYEYKLGKKKLREIDARIHRLQKMLESFEVINPRTRPATDRVFFGATAGEVEVQAWVAVVGDQERFGEQIDALLAAEPSDIQDGSGINLDRRGLLGDRCPAVDTDHRRADDDIVSPDTPAIRGCQTLVERALTEALGDAYRSYAARTKRLIPGIY